MSSKSIVNVCVLQSVAWTACKSSVNFSLNPDCPDLFVNLQNSLYFEFWSYLSKDMFQGILYCETVFCCIWILWFSYVENLLHLTWQIFTIRIPIALLFSYDKEYCMSHHRIVDILCKWWWAILKIHVCLISPFYSNCKNLENLMLVKYTCFTVNTCVFDSASFV